MNFTEGRERARSILADDPCVYTAPVFDITSLRIAEDLGFGMLPMWPR